MKHMAKCDSTCVGIGTGNAIYCEYSCQAPFHESMLWENHPNFDGDFDDPLKNYCGHQ